MHKRISDNVSVICKKDGVKLIALVRIAPFIELFKRRKLIYFNLSISLLSPIFRCATVAQIIG